MKSAHVISLTIGMFAISSAWAAECRVSDIQVDSLRSTNGQIATRLMGRIVNRCSEPTGVQVKFIFYDRSGELVKVVDAWPASTTNVASQSDFPFEFSVEKVNAFARVEARVIRVERWK